MVKRALAVADKRSVGVVSHPWRVESHILMGIVLPGGLLVGWVGLLLTR